MSPTLYKLDTGQIHRKDLSMHYIMALALLLLIVGGINWLLVGIMEFDLVASLTGSTFGETNAISTIVYTLVGVSALVLIPTLVSWLTETDRQTVTPHA